MGAFNNALNEAARDSDVYRIFARGQGFLATVKCQRAFRLGCFADFLAMMAAVTAYVSWAEVLILSVILTCVFGRVFRSTALRLWRTGTLLKYWREEAGGKP